MRRSEYKRCVSHYIIRCLNRIGIVSNLRVLHSEKNQETHGDNEGNPSEGVGRSDSQAKSYRSDTKGRDIFGPDRVDFIGDFEVYKLVRDTFSKQGLSYRADYYRTAWDRNGGAKLTPQTTG